MRFSEGLFAAQSAATLLCSLPSVRKFREGLPTRISHANYGSPSSSGWAEGIQVLSGQ